MSVLIADPMAVAWAMVLAGVVGWCLARAFGRWRQP